MKFAPYVCLGDPNLAFTKQLIKALEPYADAFEFGIPFSDPLADGPVIQAASERSLKNGMNTDKAFEFMEELRKEKFAKPIYIMTYYNVLFAYGLGKFGKRCKGLVQGVIVPDVPLEEQVELKGICDANNLAIIQLVTPTTTEDRIKQIVHTAKGFVYVVSVAGTTGARKELPDLRKTVQTVKRHTSIPVFIGFGISKPEQVTAAHEQGFDGFIVGSKIVECYAERTPFDGLKSIEELIKTLNNH